MATSGEAAAAAAATTTTTSATASSLMEVATMPSSSSPLMLAATATSNKKDGTPRTVGDVERSLEVLDNVLSEYDERDTPLSSLEPGGEAGAGAAAAAATARTASALITAPRQSEDDGYVSMNGRRCFSCTADYRGNTAAQQLCRHGSEGTSPPTTTAAATVVDALQPQAQSPKHQVTLPKTRTTEMISRFASLPSTTVGTSLDTTLATLEPRAILGIGISAVHSAVLSGVTRIPETILNEHPVTIYPGPSISATNAAASAVSAASASNKRSSNSASPRNIHSQSSSGSSGSGGPASPRELNDNIDAGHQQHHHHYHHHINESASSVATPALAAPATRSPSVTRATPQEQEQKLSKLFASAMRTSEEDAGLIGSSELITLKSVFSNAARLSGSSSSNNNHQPVPENRRSFAGGTADTDVEFEEFSDDSLEEAEVTTEHSSRTPSMASSMTSLPPPAQQLQQQHQPQQSVAPLHQLRQVADVHAVQNGFDDGDNESDSGVIGTEAAALVAADNGPWVLREDIVLSQSVVFGRKSNLIEPLEYNFSAVNNTQAAHRHDIIEPYAGDDDEWPQPPPASTSDEEDDDEDDDDDENENNEDDEVDGHVEDDADSEAAGCCYMGASSAEVKINDTYVIRKGCKQRVSVQTRHQFSPIAQTAGALADNNGSSIPSSVNPSTISHVAPTNNAAVLAAAEQLCTTNAKFVSSIRVPFTRHSIDLGGGGSVASAPPPSVDPKQAARTRLSLDLGSPNKALPPPPMSTIGSQNSVRPSAPSPTPTAAAIAPSASFSSYQCAGAGASNHNNNNNAKAVLSPRYSEFKKYKSTFDAFYALDVTNSNHAQRQQQQQQQQQHHQQQLPYPHNNNAGAASAAAGNRSSETLDDDQHHHHHHQHHHQHPDSAAALMRVSSLPTISPAISSEQLSTPRRELAPPLEEDEEQDSERDVPLRQIENNISALLRGDIAVARLTDHNAGRRPSIGLRSGVHKSESAKEMLLSQNMFGPLPPSPPASISSQEESYGFPPLPPLPPSPTEPPHPMSAAATSAAAAAAAYTEIGPPSSSTSFSTSSACRSHGMKPSAAMTSSARRESASGGDRPPSIPPHRGPSINTLKTRSMDAGISRSHRAASASSHQLLSTSSTSPQCPAKSNSYDKHRSPNPPATGGATAGGSTTTRRRMIPNGFPKRVVQSPRDEHRLQTSLSLPETPIFARGCDVPRTPHRRTQPEQYAPGGSRTAPRQQTSCLNSSVMGIGNTLDSRHKLLGHQAFAGGEMLRLAGGPARGWYPRQRQQQHHQQHHHHQQQRPLSTENLEGLSSRSARFWDGDTTSGGRKPLTLPPNLSPKFFNKSPRDALRRVTSLLIRKGASDSKKDKDASIKRNFHHTPSDEVSSIAQPKKKGFFKSFWKKSKHISLDK